MVEILVFFRIQGLHSYARAIHRLYKNEKLSITFYVYVVQHTMYVNIFTGVIKWVWLTSSVTVTTPERAGESTHTVCT